MPWLYHIIRYTLVRWGYWAIVAGLLGENAGLPVPGETVLMFASFLAHKHTRLDLMWVVAVGTAAAITGDNLDLCSSSPSQIGCVLLPAGVSDPRNWVSDCPPTRTETS